jgi:hypothetical protein
MSENAAEGTDQNGTGQDFQSLPEWAQNEITKARNEAASYRVRAKETADKVRNEVTTQFSAQVTELSDKVADLSGQLQKSQLDSEKLSAAIAVGIPGESAVEFAALLQGSNAEEIAAHAQKVKGLFGTAASPQQQAPTRAVDPAQGLGNGSAAQSPGDLFGDFIQGKLTR